MREIKFRGKDRENWHYGDLVQEIRHNDNKIFDGVIYHIKNLEYENGSYIGDTSPVVQESIGQYTGLHDKNGKEIYEGDIVYIRSEDENAVIVWDKEIARFKVCFDGWFSDFDSYYESDLELAGNIYDNKGLLENRTDKGVANGKQR